MKIRTIIMIAASLFAAASCTGLEQNATEIPGTSKYIIYANSADTRTSMDQEGIVTWKKGDAIKVAVRNTPSDKAALAEFKNTAADGLKKATFEGLVLPAQENLTAIYPASAFQSESSEGSLVTIPAEQFGVAGNFPVDANGSSVFPAFAYYDHSDAGQIVMDFKHIAGLFGVVIPEYLENISQIELECTGASLAGDFNLAVADASIAELTPAAAVSKIVLKPSAGAKVFAAGKYYAAMAPGKYKGIKITLTTAVGGTFVRTSDTFAYEIKRNGRVRFDLSRIIANAKVGDCFLADGTWADASKEKEGKVDGKEVIGYVISTENKMFYDVIKKENSTLIYSLSSKLQNRAGHFFHGYVVSDDVLTLSWGTKPGNPCGSHTNADLANMLDAYPYWVYHYNATIFEEASGKSENFGRCRGFSNSAWWLLDTGSYNSAMFPALAPENTSGWYVPSTGDFENILIPNKNIFVPKIGFSDAYWTSSISHKRLQTDMAVFYNATTEQYSFGGDFSSSKKKLYLLAF